MQNIFEFLFVTIQSQPETFTKTSENSEVLHKTGFGIHLEHH